MSYLEEIAKFLEKPLGYHPYFDSSFYPPWCPGMKPFYKLLKYFHGCEWLKRPKLR